LTYLYLTYRKIVVLVLNFRIIIFSPIKHFDMKQTLIIFFAVILALSGFSQQKIEHPSRLFKAEDGKLYIQKEMPVYLYISTSKDGNSEKVLLESEDSKDYTNPMYFDTEGKNTFHSPWKVDTVTKKYKYPLEDIIFEVYADSRPPYTSIKDKNKGFKSGDRVFFSEGFTLELIARDKLSGIMQTYYSIDGSPYKKYTGSIELDKEKEYKILYYSVDNVGNEEKVRSINIFIDKSEPKTIVKVIGDKSGNVVSSRSEFVIESTEEGSGLKAIYYKTNNNSIKLFKYPIKTSWFSEGEHSISFYAIDNVGNKEEMQKFEFYVDKTPPIIVEEIVGNTFVANGLEYSSGRSKYKITAMDNKAGVKSIHYQVGNEESKDYTEPFYLSAAKGTLKIKTWVYDEVNNKSYGGSRSSKQGAAYIDLTGPSLKNKFSGPYLLSRDTVFIAQTTKLILTATDSESGLDRIDYSIDGNEEIGYEKPFSLNVDGLHRISYNGYDKVGNISQSEFFFIVDNVGPKINIDYSVESIGSKTALDKKIKVYPSHLQVFLSATDNLVGLEKIYYKINDGSFIPYSTSIKNFDKGRDYKLFIKAIDRLGNESTEEVIISINL
jgi:hypothetical protein